MPSLSILQRATSLDVLLEPYPHLILKNALPDHLCNELKLTYPSLQAQGVDIDADNYRWSTHSSEIHKIHAIAPLWREFIEYHTSQRFLNEILQLFELPLLNLYPNRFPSRNALQMQMAQKRNVGCGGANILMLDAQISGNTPAKTAGSPRGVHFDAPHALYGGLYYLRDENDDSVGGDLQMWQWNPRYSNGKKSGEYREDVPRHHIELVKTIPYESNLLVIFINSIDSLHSVTVRQPTIHTRKFVNLLADSDSPFFDLRARIDLRSRNILKRLVKSAF